MLATLTILAVAFITGLIFALGWLTIVYPDRRFAGSGRAVEVAISKGSSARAVARYLADQGVIGEPAIFALYVRLIGADRKLNSGRVMLQDSMSVREIVQRLASGFGYAELRVTIPEGHTRFDIADSFERWGVCRKEAFIKATADEALLGRYNIKAANAEGYLFPDTYQLKEGTDEKSVLARLLANFQRRIETLEHRHSQAFARLKSEMDWERHQVLILASIVEKEASDLSEQPIIAGVFFNRLRRPEFPLRRLQADPTVAYGCRIAVEPSSACARFDGNQITRAMTQDESNPYNTYRLEGLPPGPISNPGLDAIRAVLEPAEHNYFYFVVSSAGRHRFSETVAEHNRAVQAYRKNESNGENQSVEPSSEFK